MAKTEGLATLKLFFHHNVTEGQKQALDKLSSTTHLGGILLRKWL